MNQYNYLNNKPNNQENTDYFKTLMLENDYEKTINFKLKNNLNNNYLPNNSFFNNKAFNENMIMNNINNNINNNLNNNIKNDINKNDKKEKTEAKVIDNLSLSSSSNDVQIVSSEEFRKHFQEDKYGTQRKIEVIQDKNPLNMPFSQYDDKLKTHINNNRNYVSQFFADNNNNLSKKK
jgi:hypothetical protein